MKHDLMPGCEWATLMRATPPSDALAALDVLLAEAQGDNIAPHWGSIGAGQLPPTERQLSIDSKLVEARRKLAEIRGGAK